MKEIVKHQASLGGQGAVADFALGVEESFLVAEVKAKYPIQKIVEPATKALDSALDKLEKVIPGDWDKPMIDKIKVEYKKELLEALSEKPA